jgi:hypothetical protein
MCTSSPGKVYIFSHFCEDIIRLFFTKLKDPIAVIEKSLKRIKLSLTGPDGPTAPTTLESFCNTLRFLFNQTPVNAPYPEYQKFSRIRERLSKQVEAYLLEWEVNNNQVVNRYDVLMHCLHRQDVLFADSIESKGTPTPSNKRTAFEAPLQVAEVVDDFKKSRKVDNRPICTHCSKSGHSIDNCWMKYPDKRSLIMRRGVGLLNPLYLSTMLPRPCFKRCCLKPLTTYIHPPTKLENLGNCVTLACL